MSLEVGVGVGGRKWCNKCQELFAKQRDVYSHNIEVQIGTEGSEETFRHIRG